jgi:hypothetical protein
VPKKLLFYINYLYVYASPETLHQENLAFGTGLNSPRHGKKIPAERSSKSDAKGAETH